MLLFLDDLEEILTILVLDHRLGKLTHAFFRDPAFAVSNSFKAGNLESLSFLYHFDECRCFRERVVGAGIEPSESSAEGLHFQFAITEEPLIDSSDLIFSSCGRLDIGCYFHYFVWIEIEAYNGIV